MNAEERCMTNCEQSEILMLKHMEKTISAEDTIKLAGHVQDCQSCREYYLAFDEAMEAMGDFATAHIELDQAPDNFTANVMVQVRKMPAAVTPAIATARQRGRVALYAFWGVSVIIVAVALVLAYNPHYLTDLAYTYPIFEGVATAMQRAVSAFGQVPEWLMNDTDVMAHNFGVAALAFVLVLGMLLVVLHKDESRSKGSATA